MPVDPTYRYADEVHPLMRALPRYGCHDHPPYDPENPPVLQAQNGWTATGRRRVVEIRTKWKPVQCGHSELSGDDPKCEGCRWRGHAGVDGA